MPKIKLENKNYLRPMMNNCWVKPKQEYNFFKGRMVNDAGNLKHECWINLLHVRMTRVLKRKLTHVPKWSLCLAGMSMGREYHIVFIKRDSKWLWRPPRRCPGPNPVQPSHRQPPQCEWLHPPEVWGWYGCLLPCSFWHNQSAGNSSACRHMGRQQQPLP